jgi:hypothetical protein
VLIEKIGKEYERNLAERVPVDMKSLARLVKRMAPRGLTEQ